MPGVPWPGRAALTLLLILAGCGHRPEPLPPTYLVRGTVTDANGKPATAGIVTFEPQDAPSVMTVGEIKSDGSYTLTTSRSRLRAEGAVAGPNRVIVALATPNNSGQSAVLPPVILPTPIIVEPKENVIPIKLGSF